ncbi:hypothetical protein CBA19CS91_01850 [Paraburkholderia hospita]|nr:hypothetical protein CBA19CS91_01850 [Paraburkholderia hospita]
MGILDNFTSWAQSPQSQPTADGLLAAGLGILARNRGLDSGWSAVGQGGLEGLQQYQQSKQLQMQQQLQNAQLQQLGFALKKNQLLYDTAANLLGGQQGAQQGSPQQPGVSGAVQNPFQGTSGAPVTGDANVGALSGLSAGMGDAAPQSAPSPDAPAATSAQPVAATAPRSSLFGNIPNQLAGFGLLTDPNKLFEIAAGQYSPTDLQKQLTAAGIQQGSPEWNAAIRAAITKSTRIEPTSLRPGAPYIGSDGQLHTTPSAAPAGYENVTPDNGQTWSTQPIRGGLDAIRASTAATSGGKAQYELQDVWDPSANGGKGGMVKQTVANVADAASGGAAAGGAAPSNIPLPLRNNNPGAVSPGGSVAQYPDLQTGLKRMDDNLASYAGQPGTGTLAGVITKWVGSPPNAPAYISDVSARLGVPANTPVDLTNPAQRQAIATAIMLHENGPRAVFGPTAVQASPPGVQQPTQGRGGAFASAPPPGFNESANFFAKNNVASYSNLRDLASTSGDRVNTLDNMLALAQGTTKFGPGWSERLERTAKLNGYLPSDLQLGSNDTANAQVLQKYMSNLAQQYQKALGGTGTDAQLATVLKGTPTPDMMNKAMIEVIPKLKAQELALQAKTNAADQWLAQNGNNLSDYNKFENAWRQNYDPRIYQMQQMTPAGRQVFLKQQPDASALRAKTATALQNGWVQ